MKTVWKNIKKGVTDGYKSLSNKTDEMTKIGRLKLEKIAIKRDIEKAFIELGGRFYHAVQKKKHKEFSSEEEVTQLIKAIKNKELKLKSLEEKIEQVRNQPR